MMVILQLPLAYYWGALPLGFDMTMKRAESTLTRRVDRTKLVLLGEELAKWGARLEAEDPDSSRRGRLLLVQAVLSWQLGDKQHCDRLLEEAEKVFVRTHGEKTFYPSAVAHQKSRVCLSSRPV